MVPFDASRSDERIALIGFVRYVHPRYQQHGASPCRCSGAKPMILPSWLTSSPDLPIGPTCSHLQKRRPACRFNPSDISLARSISSNSLTDSLTQAPDLIDYRSSYLESHSLLVIYCWTTVQYMVENRRVLKDGMVSETTDASRPRL